MNSGRVGPSLGVVGLARSASAPLPREAAAVTLDRIASSSVAVAEQVWGNASARPKKYRVLLHEEVCDECSGPSMPGCATMRTDVMLTTTRRK